MKILKGIFRQGPVDDERTWVKSARLHEAASEKPWERRWQHF